MTSKPFALAVALTGTFAFGSSALAQQRSIVNPGFENGPYMPRNDSYGIIADTRVEGWLSTDGTIELWDSGHIGQASSSGAIFAELNPNRPVGIYQEICLQNGEVLSWGFDHAARAQGAATQAINYEVVDATGGLVQLLQSSSLPRPASHTGNSWTTRTGSTTYTGPSGVQRLQFRSTNAGSTGNFLDNIQIDLVPYVEMAQASTTGSEAAGDYMLQVLIAGQVTSTVNLPFSIVGGTATQDVDYQVDAGTVTIPAGNYDGVSASARITLPITILDDLFFEEDETIMVQLADMSTSLIKVAPITCLLPVVRDATYTIASNDHIFANDQTPPVVNGASGGSAGNVMTNDEFEGALNPTVGSDVTINRGGTAQDGATLGLDQTPAVGGITLNPATGEVTVAANTTAGTYVYTYEICAAASPTTCATGTQTITVTAAAIAANADDGTTGNVVINDTFNGNSNPSIGTDVTVNTAGTAQDGVALGLNTPPGSGGITLNPNTGQITVAPGTTAGTYTYTYEICDIANPSNCATAVATVVVDPARIAAENGTSPSLIGADGGTVAGVVANDTLNGVTNPTIGTEVSLNETGTALDGTTLGLDTVPASGGITMNPATGEISVAAGTTTGTYVYTYEICEVLNPSNCSVASETFMVNAVSIAAVNGTSPAFNGAKGGTIANVVANDTLNGVTNPAIGMDVSLNETGVAQDGTALGLDSVPAFGGITMNVATGEISVAAGTTAGTYVYTYEICEVLNPSNCSVATETITVDAATILAVDGGPMTINGSIGGTLSPVVRNDSLNGSVDPALGTDIYMITSGTSVDGHPLGLDTMPASGGITMNPNTGEITVAPGTPAGTYVFAYEIGEMLNPTNCSAATETIIVAAAALGAVDDLPAPIDGASGGVIGNVVANDNMNGVVNPVIGTDVSVNETGTAQDGTTLGLDTVPAAGGITMNAATGEVSVAAGTTAGTYIYTYEICEILNPINCATATVTIVVAPPFDDTSERIREVLRDDLETTVSNLSNQFGSTSRAAGREVAEGRGPQCVVRLNKRLKEDPVLFQTDGDVIATAYADVLDELVDILASCPGEVFEIEGHMDSRGSDSYNLALSQRRANAFRAALIDRGLEAQAFISRGYGESRPIASNDNAEGQRMNRRVVFRSIEDLEEEQSRIAQCEEAQSQESKDQPQTTGMINLTATHADIAASVQDQAYDCETGRTLRQGIDARVTRDTAHGTQVMINGRVALQEATGDKGLRGIELSGYASQSQIDDDGIEGEIQGMGANATLYGAHAADNGFVFDGYVSAGLGYHAFSLEDKAHNMTAEGAYAYGLLAAGLGVSGRFGTDYGTFSPRVAAAMTLSQAELVEGTLMSTTTSASRAAGFEIGTQAGYSVSLGLGYESLPVIRNTDSEHSVGFDLGVQCEGRFDEVTQTCGHAFQARYNVYGAERTWSVEIGNAKIGTREETSLGLEMERQY